MSGCVADAQSPNPVSDPCRTGSQVAFVVLIEVAARRDAGAHPPECADEIHVIPFGLSFCHR
jgi:hypothetical protein